MNDLPTTKQYMEQMTTWADENHVHSFYYSDLPGHLKIKNLLQKASYSGYIKRITTSKSKTVALWRIELHVRNTSNVE